MPASKKRILKYIALTVIIIGLITGVMVVIFVQRVIDYNTYVKLENSSGEDIKSIRLIHKYGVIDVRDLKKGQSKTVKFLFKGENYYSLEVEFQSGNKIEGEGGYIESGYHMTSTIYKNDVKTTYVSYY